MELVALDLHSTDHALDPADHRRGFLHSWLPS